MAVEVIDRGAGNQVQIDALVQKIGSGTITINGNDNEIFVGPNCIMNSVRLVFGSSCKFTIKGGGRIAAVEVFSRKDAIIEIGHNVQFTWGGRLLLHESGRIAIGDNCLIASGVLLTVSDMHSIKSLDTGERINPAADIVVEDQVWLAADVRVMKGVRIGTGSVIGLGSIVTRDIPANCLAAGAPARVIRERITWTPDLV